MVIFSRPDFKVFTPKFKEKVLFLVQNSLFCTNMSLFQKMTCHSQKKEKLTHQGSLDNSFFYKPFKMPKTHGDRSGIDSGTIGGYQGVFLDHQGVQKTSKNTKITNFDLTTLKILLSTSRIRFWYSRGSKILQKQTKKDHFSHPPRRGAHCWSAAAHPPSHVLSMRWRKITQRLP